MNYASQIHLIGNVQHSLSNTQLATRQALSHLATQLLSKLIAELDIIGLTLFWQEEFVDNQGQTQGAGFHPMTQVAVYDGSNKLADFTFDPREADSIESFICDFEECMSYYIAVKTMETKLALLPEKDEETVGVSKI